ncbi:putative biotin ligase [Astathelohania contejeani]|uniref:Biotin ligase n=1 Tax=Astathelohania contejeani TaxID=164912 RepID=A0ABQ7I1F9_9MICR|nr:putative biotin ligase [Thelohania contejeani]
MENFNLIKIIECLPSTQDYIINKVISREYVEGTVIIANKQTAGKGRSGRSWVTIDGGLAFSVGFSIHGWISTIINTGITTHLCNAVCAVLESFEISSYHKWPNDVYIDEYKVCGILIDIREEMVIIGIGINLIGSHDVYKSIWDLTKIKIDNNLFICNFLKIIKLDKIKNYTFMPSQVYYNNKEYELLKMEKDRIFLSDFNGNVIIMDPDKHQFIMSKRLFLEK